MAEVVFFLSSCTVTMKDGLTENEHNRERFGKESLVIGVGSRSFGTGGFHH